MHFNKLPDELLFKIIYFVKLNRLKKNDKKQLALCCLVCRRWLRIAQPLLFEQIELEGPLELEQLHHSLMTSNKLPGYVRELTVWDSYDFRTNLKTGRSIGDCLKLTNQLEKLRINTRCSYLVTNFVVHQICCLSKLKSLTFTDPHGFQPKRRSRFDPRLLLELPKSLEELQLDEVSDNLLSLLPNICAKLQASHEQEQRTWLTGLRALSVSWCSTQRHPNNKFTLIGLSVPTLTSFTLTDYHGDAEDSTLFDFLSATPLLEHLHLIRTSAVLLDSLPPLTRLRSLNVCIRNESQQPHWAEFCRSVSKSISYSHCFDTFIFNNSIVLRDGSQLIEAVVTSTTKIGAFSTLRNFHLHNRGGSSIDALEHLCRSAPLLQNLTIGTHPKDMSRAASAIESLKHLISVKLWDFQTRRTYPAGCCLGGEKVDVSSLFEKVKFLAPIAKK